MPEDKLVYDALNHQPYHLTEGVFLSEIDGRLKHLITHDYPYLEDGDFISNKDLLHYRLLFLNRTIERAQDKNDRVRETVYQVSKNKDYQTVDVPEAWDRKVTFGQRIADDVARFGGSWTFIISFTLFMAAWMALNVYQPFGIHFDAYPFILLNLALSTLAAIQAPLIMMSQNRASDYDRFQAKNDFNVNKKSEEGIRLLHTKMDHLVQQDQSDLLEVQKLQTEMLASITQQLDNLQQTNYELKEQLVTKKLPS
ncbi:membrane protein [Streptococcus criceti]|uniref:Uncharacterized protein n=1 Tax=Streptococcus criceti HS-6 TaxID=873449 RepID=G5JRG9_STRCG|nr:DUF1003 domain-containing protein [Streptococcus criceti]EHI73349.1 hypothetical protein STRCR_1977 [Streptococcus criceti HS-6]SUN42938.1 membrane protein [Streptococcus criceti]